MSLALRFFHLLSGFRRKPFAAGRRFRRLRVFNLLLAAAALSLCLHPARLSAELETTSFEPQPIRIKIEDLPSPDRDHNANKQPKVDRVPDQPVLMAPPGFVVSVFAENMEHARWLALTPEGGVLLAQSRGDKISLLRDTDGDGSIDTTTVFADKRNGLNAPFGMAFLGDRFFLGNTDGVRSYPWKKGQLALEGEGEEIAELPGGGYNQHWTRNVIADANQRWLYVAVGSKSNVDVEESPRATILRMRPDGSERTVFASGLRNPVGLALHPGTGALYATVNERDELGDDLVPDYLTRVEEGGFYGWPYAYLRPNLLDPRRMKDGRSERPDLAEKTLSPDVLFESHSAALGLCFSEGKHFPERYRRGAFVAFRGSWNRSKGTGYKIVFVPFDEEGRPAGHYEDFVRGFLTDESAPRTWGRPVGVIMLPDGSLLFSEEENGRLYRVTYRPE